jgi:hypothetical protein
MLKKDHRDRDSDSPFTVFNEIDLYVYQIQMQNALKYKLEQDYKTQTGYDRPRPVGIRCKY